MKRVFACLWQGTGLPSYSADRYDLDYVKNLSRGVAKHMPGAQLTLLADDVYTKRMIQAALLGDDFGDMTLDMFAGHGVGGWSNVLEIFRPDLWPAEGERYVAMGLDTIMVRDCSWLFEWDLSPIGIPLDPYAKPTPCDAVITWNREGAEIVWNEFMRSVPTKMREHLYGGKPSEMALLRNLDKIHNWKRLEPNFQKLLSYKAHVYKNAGHWRKETTLVYFHGDPKPAQLPNGDLKRAWQHP